MRLYKLLFACIFLLFTIGCSQELPPFKTQRVCKVPSIIEYTKTGTDAVTLSLKGDSTDIKSYDWKMKESLTGLPVTIPNKSGRTPIVPLTKYTLYDVTCDIITKCETEQSFNDTYEHIKDKCKNPTSISYGIPPGATFPNTYKFNLKIDGDTSDIDYVVWEILSKATTGAKDVLIYTSDTLKLSFSASTYQFHPGKFTINAYITNKCNVKDTLTTYYEKFFNVSKELSLSKDDMIKIEGGTFTMGNNTSDDEDSKPEHQVTVSTFYLSKYEVTQELWSQLMPKNNSVHTNCPKCPVTNVTLNEVDTFLKNLEMVTGKAYRLPTEAEWEYAVKGGQKQKTFKYSGSDILGSVAWYSANSNNNSSEVGKKEPNDLGIFDMTGNVWELVSDWFAPYPSTPQVNPKGPLSGTQRIARGGSWRTPAKGGSTLKDYFDNNFRSNNDIVGDAGAEQSGFRLARNP